MKALLIIALLATLSGCAYVSLGVQKASKAADTALGSSVWYVCKGATIGAVTRRFGNHTAAYNNFCSAGTILEEK